MQRSIDSLSSRDRQPDFESLEPRLLLSMAAFPLDAVGFSDDVPVLQAAATAGTNGTAEAATGTLIADVPAYYWYRGCGPTAAGMIIGYWDSKGYDALVPGDASTQTAAVDDMIASPEHYADYAQPIDSTSTGILPDKSSTGGAHANNSVADWMQTSWSSRNNYYGWSWFSNMDDGLEGYAQSTGYANADAWNETWGALEWDDLVAEVDAGRPMLFLVDTDGNAYTDHIVTAIGYDATTNQYAAHNTWDYSVHWYDFAPLGSGQEYGIYGATFFDPGQDSTAPTAEVDVADISTRGNYAHAFTVTFSDNEAVDVSTLDSSDVRVTGPDEFDQLATFVGVDVGTDGTPRTAIYSITAPTGTWYSACSGTYTISLEAGQVSDTSGNLADAGTLGYFDVTIDPPEIDRIPHTTGDTPEVDLRSVYFSVPKKKKLKAGSTVQTTFEVENVTGASTGAFTVSFYLSAADSVTTGDYLLGEYTVDAIGDSGTTGELIASFTLPFARNPDSPYVRGIKTYRVGMIIDPADAVEEVDEANNANVGTGLDSTLITVRSTKPKDRTSGAADDAGAAGNDKVAKLQRKAEKNAAKLERKRLKAEQKRLRREAKLAASGGSTG